MVSKTFKKLLNKRKNHFRYTKEKETFKIVSRVRDMGDNPYIIKFRYTNNTEFFLMYSDFKEQINIGKIVFAEY